MQQVERGQLWVMRIHAMVVAVMLLTGAAVVEMLIARRTDLPTGLIAVPVLLLVLYALLVAPMRQFKALGYAVDVDELRVRSGVWIRTETVVPLKRVQHIDVSQGPVERSCGVTRLVLHTAGTMNSLVVLPGLARTTAESIRDEIRARIRQDPA
jgi:hypothetical protein